MMSKVSICIPVYNGEAYLEEVLVNVLKQTYENIEVVIINDNSKDRSEEIIERHCSVDKRILYHRNHSNVGMVKNWNDCLLAASGDFVKLHFQDDLMDIDAISKMVNCAKIFKAELVISDRDYFLDNQKESTFTHLNQIEKLTDYYKLPQFIDGEQMFELIKKTRLKNNFIGEPIVGLISRKVIKEGNNYDQNFQQRVDFEYWLRVGLKYGIAYLPETIHHFRVHNSSQSSRNVKLGAISPINLDKLRLVEKMITHEDYSSIRSSEKFPLIESLASEVLSLLVSKYGIKKFEKYVDMDFLRTYDRNKKDFLNRILQWVRRFYYNLGTVRN